VTKKCGKGGEGDLAQEQASSNGSQESHEELDRWFKREVLIHEEALVRFLTRSWPNRDEIIDLRQDIYIRVYEAAVKSRPLQPKSFLFATARHLMTDLFRRKRVVSIDSVGDLESLNVISEGVSPEEQASAHEELRRLAVAIDSLPPRCREVVWLRRVDEIPQKEVAVQLGIAQKTVEKHVMKGVKLLANALRRGDHPRHELSEQVTGGTVEADHGRSSRD
jgi:RNA polymerase sigma-70 factor (ECF subfamily)